MMTEQGIVIREAAADDYKAIQKLSVQLGHEYPVDGVRENLISILQENDQRIFLAVNTPANSIVGYIHVQKYRTLYSDVFLNILGLVVDDAWRKKGVGSSLLKRTEMLAAELNCAGLRAASSESRVGAHAFYRRNGFDIVKNQKRFIKLLNKT